MESGAGVSLVQLLTSSALHPTHYVAYAALEQRAKALVDNLSTGGCWWRKRRRVGVVVIEARQCYCSSLPRSHVSWLACYLCERAAKEGAEAYDRVLVAAEAVLRPWEPELVVILDRAAQVGSANGGMWGLLS